jgi:hypothetical protein
MRNLTFIGHNHVGDAVMAYMVIDALCCDYPDIAVYCYNKNGDSVSAILTKHPNVKESGKISTKLFRKSLYRDVYLLYKKIKVLLKNDDVYISSLIGSSTLYFALLPFLIWLRLTQKHKVHILQLRPKWFKYNGHLLDFHLDMISKCLGANIEYREKSPLFAGKKKC